MNKNSNQNELKPNDLWIINHHAPKTATIILNIGHCLINLKTGKVWSYIIEQYYIMEHDAIIRYQE